MNLPLTLAALALAGVVAPSAYAVSIVEAPDLTVNPTMQLQARLSRYNANDATGNDFNPENPAIANDKDDPLDFMLRRARFGFTAKYGEDWKAAMIFTGEGAYSSKNLMFPTLSEYMLGADFRDVGAGYRLTAPVARFSLDVQNPTAAKI